MGLHLVSGEKKMLNRTHFFTQDKQGQILSYTPQPNQIFFFHRKCSHPSVACILLVIFIPQSLAIPLCPSLSPFLTPSLPSTLSPSPVKSDESDSLKGRKTSKQRKHEMIFKDDDQLSTGGQTRSSKKDQMNLIRTFPTYTFKFLCFRQFYSSCVIFSF